MGDESAEDSITDHCQAWIVPVNGWMIEKDQIIGHNVWTRVDVPTVEWRIVSKVQNQY